MLPQQQPPSSRATHDFAPSSPPDHVMFHRQQQENPSAPSLHYRSSLEFRRRSGPGFANGNSALAPPHGPPPMPNGGSRHRGTMSLGGFEGGKSPPSTKSGSKGSGHVCTTANTPPQTLPMCRVNSSGVVNVKQDQPARFHIPSISQRSIRRVSTSLRYAFVTTLLLLVRRGYR